MAQNVRKNMKENPFIKLDLDSITGYDTEDVEKHIKTKINHLLQNDELYTKSAMHAKERAEEYEGLISSGESPDDKEVSDYKERHANEKKEAMSSRIQKGKNVAELDAWTEKQNLFDNNPKLYSKLAALHDSSKADVINTGTYDKPVDTDMNKTKIAKDANGDLYLAVDMMKPSEFSFKIYDGKLEFSLEGMTAEKMREMIDYLERRGLASAINYGALKNLDENGQEDSSKLLTVENADGKTIDMFNAVLKDKREEFLSGAGEEDTYMPFVQADDEKSVGGIDNDDNTTEGSDNPVNGEDRVDTAEEIGQQSAGNEGIPIPAAPKSEPIDINLAKKKAIASLSKWANTNRRKGLSYFESFENGYFVITTFPNENRNNMKNDCVIDEKGNLKATHECKYYVKVNKRNKLEINFSMPPGGRLSLDHVDRIMDAFNDAGISRVKFGPMRDDYEAVIREGCGKALIVPVGIKLTKTRIDKMIKQAADKHGDNTNSVMEYKYKLAQQLASNLMQKGVNAYDPKNKDDADCRAVRHLTAEYKLSGFRNLWEDFGLRGKYEDIIDDNSTKKGNPDGAAKIAGAAFAVNRLYKLYSHSVMPGAWYNEPLSIDHTLETAQQNNLLSGEEIKKFKELMNKNNVDGNQSFMKCDPELKKAIFDIIHVTETNKARYAINKEYHRITSSQGFIGGGESKERQAIRQIMPNAFDAISEVRDDIKETGLKPIHTASLTNPDHDFSVRSKEEKISEQKYGEGNRFGPDSKPKPAPLQPPFPSRGGGGRRS